MTRIRVLEIGKSTAGIGTYMRWLAYGLDLERFELTFACLSEGSTELVAELSSVKDVQAISWPMNRFKVDVFSDLLFIISLFHFVTISLPGPYTFVWITSLILFLFELFLAISYDEEDSMTNLFILILMYFTYSQLWIYVVIKSAYQDFIKKDNRVWDKTIRFDTTESQSKK